MNCIDQIQLQKYIDKECSDREKAAIEEHLSECSICKLNYSKLKEQSSSIKNALNLFNSNNIEIPVFKKPLKTKFQKIENYIIYSLSAACLLLFVLIVVDKTNQKTKNQIALNPTWEFDSNRPITEQPLRITVTDPNGNSSEFFIE